MSKYLERAKEIRAIVEPHHNCAQSVLMTFNKDAGVSDELAYKMGSDSTYPAVLSPWRPRPFHNKYTSA